MLQMGIYKYNVYRSPNIGIYLKANDKIVLAPKGMARSKMDKLESMLNVRCINVSIANTRLIGVLLAMNNNSIILPRTVEEQEMMELKDNTEQEIIVLEIKQTSIGNLIAINDKGAIISSKLPKDVASYLKDRLGIEVIQLSIANYHQVGAIIACTNNGAAIHPKADDQEIDTIASVLKVNVEPATVNNGIPFVSSGIVANASNVVVGNLTTGPEMIMLSKAFNV